MCFGFLERAAEVSRVGGRLVYSTCTLLREENEDVVESFLAATPAFRRVPREAHPETLGLWQGVYLLT